MTNIQDSTKESTDSPGSSSSLLLRSKAGMVMLNLEVDVVGELDGGLKFLLGSLQLVQGSQPQIGHRRMQASYFECRVAWTVLQNVFWVLDSRG